MELRDTPVQLREQADHWGKIVYQVVVVDVYTSMRGYCEEQCVTTNKGEADTWAKQWKREYNSEDGFQVKRAQCSPTMAPR